MLNKFLKLTTLLLLVVAGVIGQSEKKPSSSDITLADINSFADTESNTEQGNNGDRPPEWWEYVPDRYIHCTTQTHKQVSTTDYSITIDGKEYKGDFIRKSHSYQIVVAVTNCDKVQEGSWCDQRRVGAKVTSITDVETGHTENV